MSICINGRNTTVSPQGLTLFFTPIGLRPRKPRAPRAPRALREALEPHKTRKARKTQKTCKTPVPFKPAPVDPPGEKVWAPLCPRSPGKTRKTRKTRKPVLDLPPAAAPIAPLRLPARDTLLADIMDVFRRMAQLGAACAISVTESDNGAWVRGAARMDTDDGVCNWDMMQYVLGALRYPLFSMEETRPAKDALALYALLFDRQLVQRFEAAVAPAPVILVVVVDKQVYTVGFRARRYVRQVRPFVHTFDVFKYRPRKWDFQMVE